MDQEKFIKLIKEAVELPAVDGIISNLNKPAGRQPEKSLLQISAWFNGLNGDEKEKIIEIVQLSVNHSIFGFLCVIDGVRSIRERSDDDEPVFKLTYIDSREELLLNNPNEEFLHDIYKSLS